MDLTPAQLATLKAHIDATPGLASQPNDPIGAEAVAAALNLPASPDFWAWDTAADVNVILDAVTWSNYTPTQVPDTSTVYQNRVVYTQTKLMGLQVVLQGRDRLNVSRPSVRNGLQDFTSDLPTGNSGNLRTGGWANVANVIRRRVTVAEKLYATQTSGAGVDNLQPLGSTANPARLGPEGLVSWADVMNARNA